MQKEQLQQLTQEANALGDKLQALNDEELSMVIGGVGEGLQLVITRVKEAAIKEKLSKSGITLTKGAALALGKTVENNDKIKGEIRPLGSIDNGSFSSQDL